MKKEQLIAGVILIALVSLGVGCQVTVWKECRASGRSFIYCARMISR